jgi:hypothetical protein
MKYTDKEHDINDFHLYAKGFLQLPAQSNVCGFSSLFRHYQDCQLQLHQLFFHGVLMGPALLALEADAEQNGARYRKDSGNSAL